MATATKDRRLNLRLNEQEEELIKQAASQINTSVTEFVINAANDRAQEVLATPRWISMTPGEFEEFERLLDATLPTEKLRKLFAKPDIFDQPITIRRSIPA